LWLARVGRRGQRRGVFIGHFGIGFAAKPVARTASLGTLFLAAQWLDLLWPALLQLGLERVALAAPGSGPIPLEFEHYPISHSLLAVVGWGALFAAVYWAARRNVCVAFVLGLCVVSHWVLDLVVHVPDLPLTPGGAERVGLGLWLHPGIEFAVELALFALGVALYLRTTRAKDRTGVVALWGLIVFLVVLHLANVFGPPPPSVAAIAWVGHLQWLLVLWGWWVDRHRVACA
jgi:hypothetical protein